MKNNSWINNIMWGAIGFIGFCLLCMAISIISSLEQTQSGIVKQPTAFPTQCLIAPSINEIMGATRNMTDAQQNSYNNSLVGKCVVDWVGTVSDVDEGEVFGGFTIYVDMTDDFGSEVHIDVTEATALSINKNQKITFSGVISSASDFLGETIFFDNAEIR